jgi:hypothetical protein
MARDGPATDGGRGGQPPARKVDILFAVDISNSTFLYQQLLVAAFPRLVHVLAGGDRDGDGSRDLPALEDVHFGIVTSDMGTGPFALGEMCPGGLGDDGILRRTPGSASGLDESQCEPRYTPPYLTLEPERATAASEAQLTAAFECLALRGSWGCSFEQPLEALLKALTPSTSSITFWDGTRGHGEGANDGFLRPDSLLVVVLWTDEDDCSAEDRRLFDPDPDNAEYPGRPSLRCFEHESALYDLERYVNGLLALRREPRRLLYAAIAGVPPELAPETTASGMGSILSAPAMVERLDPNNPLRLAASCSSPVLTHPPRRIVEVAKGLRERGAHALVTSSCTDEHEPVLEVLIDSIATAVAGAH